MRGGKSRKGNGSRMTIITVSSFLFASLSFAADYFPIVRYSCDTEHGILRIDHHGLWGLEGRAFRYSEKDGTYNPWEFVRDEHRPGHIRVVAVRSVEKICVLSGRPYQVVIEPHAFDWNDLGDCRAPLSAAVTILLGGRTILPRTPLERNCRDDLPVITRIELDGRSGKVEITKQEKEEFYSRR